MSQKSDVSVKLAHELREYVTLRRRAELAEEEAKAYRQEADEQRDRLWDIMEAAGLKTLNHELGRMSRMVRQKAIVTDDETLAHFLAEEGIYDAMTKRAWRQANLNALASETIENGDQLPPGLDSIAIKGIRYTPNK